jgi:hypothetical protein
MPSESISATRGKPGLQAARTPGYQEVVVGTDRAGRRISIPFAGGLEGLEENAGVMTLLKLLGVFDEKPPKFVRRGSKQHRRIQKRYQGKWSWHPNARR